MKPKKWTDVYPHGTKEGDEELKFFISLARNPKYQWRSISAISKEASLSKERVEEIMNKYYKKGMVFQNPKNEDQWGYWERVPEMLPKAEKTISQKDHQDRINKSSKACSMAGFPSDDMNSLCQKASSDYCDSPVMLDPETAAPRKGVLTRYGKKKWEEHCQDQWGKSGKNLNEFYKGQAIRFDPKQITHHKISDKRNVFYVDIKTCSPGDAEAFIIRMKEYFQKKKEVKAIEEARGYKEVPVEERWTPPTTDEDIWIPIRPKAEEKISDEEYFRKKLTESLVLPHQFFYDRLKNTEFVV